jgi:predicted permease
MTVEGHAPEPGERLVTHEELVTNDYFSTVGLRLLAGRYFNSADERRGGLATIINETMARRFFGNTKNALGKRWSYDDTINEHAFTIVGVVQDARYLDLRESTPNMAYHPMVAFPDEAVSSLEMRTAGDPAALVATVERAIRESVPELPVVDILPFSQRVARAATAERLVAQLTRAFSMLAVILAAVGLYGTLSYAVSRRTGELGLRMALGADRTSVLRLVMREAMVLVGLGAGIGVPLAFLAGRALKGLLFGVAPLDPLIYASGVLILMGISLTAAYVPAHRAASIDPMAAVREG